MPKFKAKDLRQRKVRRTNAPFAYLDEDGNAQSANITVIYRNFTVKEGRELADKYEKLDGKLYLSQILAEQLDPKGLPDFVDDDDNPVTVTPEFLEEFDIANLRAITEAINDDVTPKSKARP